jgi:hypothetical protein
MPSIALQGGSEPQEADAPKCQNSLPRIQTSTSLLACSSEMPERSLTMELS